MKTNLTSVMLALGLGILSFAPQSASGFYNPSTGRWISRDPAAEEGGANVYSSDQNDCQNGTDPLGRAAIFLGFGYDTSIKNVTRTHNVTNRQLQFLFRMVLECIRMKVNRDPCQQCRLGEVPGISAQYDSNQQGKDAPEDGDYFIEPGSPGQPAPDVELAEAHYRKIAVGSVPVLLTRSKIKAWPYGRLSWGWGDEGKGVLLWYSPILPSFVLAHELGHYAGYRGDAEGDPSHSSNPDNLMHEPPTKRAKPDCQWCQKVFGLGK